MIQRAPEASLQPQPPPRDDRSNRIFTTPWVRWIAHSRGINIADIPQQGDRIHVSSIEALTAEASEHEPGTQAAPSAMSAERSLVRTQADVTATMASEHEDGSLAAHLAYAVVQALRKCQYDINSQPLAFVRHSPDGATAMMLPSPGDYSIDGIRRKLNATTPGISREDCVPLANIIDSSAWGAVAVAFSDRSDGGMTIGYGAPQKRVAVLSDSDNDERIAVRSIIEIWLSAPDVNDALRVLAHIKDLLEITLPDSHAADTVS